MAAAFYRVSPDFGLQLLALVVCFWCGFGLMFCADSLDSRPIDDRKFLSKYLSAAGALTTLLSVIGFAFWILRYAVALAV